MKTAITTKASITTKTAMILNLPGLHSYFCGRHESPMAKAAQRRGNAAGRHGGPAKYGTRERRQRRREERAAQLGSSKSALRGVDW